MAKLILKQDKCKGCRLCIDACPKKILELDETKVNPKGYNPISCTDMEECIGCAFCAVVCPDTIIEVQK